MKQTAINKHLVSRLTALLLLGVLTFAGNVLAGASAVEGIVKDATGRPIGGADVRVEAKNRGLSRLVKTDARGHYIHGGLNPGTTYRVTLIINGTAKASINNVLAKVGSTQLNFDLKTSSVSGNRMVTKNGKHYVYIPDETGTHLGGRWVEVDDNGQADSIGVNNIERANAEALRRMQSNSGAVGQTVGGGR
jgi:Carboxypeptidase regulatory-like domain